MNIFILDRNPKKAAIYQCDKHVVKMVLESAQMLCSAHRILDGDLADSSLYKLTHANHPCSVWLRQSDKNYLWLYRHFIALCDEYQFRYNKVHKTDIKLREKLKKPPKNIKLGKLTEFAQAMDDELKQDDAVMAYRNYYRKKQETIAMAWTRRRKPRWL